MWEYNELDIYEYYIGCSIQEGVFYPSPFRNDGHTNSLSFKYFHNTLYWKDFGGLDENPYIGSKRDVVGFIMQKHGFNNRADSDKFILNLIESDDYKMFISNRKDRKVIKHHRLIKEPPVYKVRSYWESYELDYWKFIDRSLLKVNKIYPCESLVYSSKKSNVYNYGSTEDSPAFLYFFDSLDSWKLYRPFETIDTGKWKSNNIGSVIEGWSQLPRSCDELIISSSTKDRLTVLTHLRIYGINPTGETSWNNIKSKARELNVRFKKIYVWLDADMTGYKNTISMCNLTNWTPILPPLWFKDNGVKDQTDMVVNGSPLFLQEFFNRCK